MTITTSSDLVSPILQSLAPGMLSVPTPDFIYRIPAQRYSMPRNGGTTLRFLRPKPLNPPIVASGNSGLEGPSQIPQRDIKDAIMSFYNTSVILNEQTVLQAQDPILAWVTERLGIAMYQAEDIILRDYLMSVVAVYNCRGPNGDNPGNFTAADASALNSSLATANAFKFLNGKLGEDRYGSGPIRAAYIMLANTEQEQDFDGLGSDFTSSWNYPNQENVAYSEYGAIRNLRIYTSSEAAVQRGASALGADVYEDIVCGREGYAHIDQDGYSSQLIYRDPIFSGPSALNATLAIKFSQAQLVTQETFMRKARCTLNS